jgi:hypothetical protein
MSEKGKGAVYRNAAIGVGIFCAVLLVAIVYSYVTYNSLLQDKDNQIAHLNSQLSSIQSQNSQNSQNLADKDATIANLQAQLSQKNSDINDLNSIVNLLKPEIWVDEKTVSQGSGAYTYWSPTASYAGYIYVWVESSTSSNTYVEVVWSSHGIDYSNKITIGTSGTAYFPVLPSNVEVRVGNTNLINGATETVTVTYYY